MSNRKPVGTQVDTIARGTAYVQPSFDLRKQDQFVTSFAVDFKHFKAMPSPVGKGDRGDYRRNNGVDTISSNGMLYFSAGTFAATMTDNSRAQKRTEEGLLDPSQSRLVLPRFYNKEGLADGERIYLAPGDRIYVADENADTQVPNYQEMDFVPGIKNVPMFPIVKMEMPIYDSRGEIYKEGVDFTITPCGSIAWACGGRNPGIDPDTGKGRIYSIRYLYRAYWYVDSLPKEVRITNVTTNGVRSPERMPQYAVIVREYIYHNQNRSEDSIPTPKVPSRIISAPVEPIDSAKNDITVDMSGFESVVEDEV